MNYVYFVHFSFTLSDGSTGEANMEFEHGGPITSINDTGRISSSIKRGGIRGENVLDVCVRNFILLRKEK